MFYSQFIKSLMVYTMIFSGVTCSITGCKAKNDSVDTSLEVEHHDDVNEENIIPNDGWNVIFITSDQHNPKVMGCAGHPIIKTPALDRLASEGMMFTNAYTANPVCSPARQSMITGLYPSEHGQVNNSVIFDSRNKTWAHYFKQHGYTTAVIGKVHDNNPSTKTLGYDYRYNPKDDPLIAQVGRKITQNEGMPPYTRVDAKTVQLYESAGRTSKSGWHSAILDDPSVSHDGDVLNKSIEYIRENKDNKFFVHISFIKPHPGHEAPENFYYMYDPDTVDIPDKVTDEIINIDPVAHNDNKKKKFVKVADEAMKMYRARYYGSLSWMDDNIGKILNELDKLDLTKKTLVIYSTDHGDMIGEKGLYAKTTTYDSAARIPLLIRMPGMLPAGQKSELLINIVDYFPTIAGLVGEDSILIENITGKDLSKAMLGKEEGPKYTFTVNMQKLGALPQQVMARSKRWKFVLNTNMSEKQKYILFDMLNDPNETKNLAYEANYKDVVKEHAEAIDNFMKNLKKPIYPAVPQKGAVESDD